MCRLLVQRGVNIVFLFPAPDEDHGNDEVRNILWAHSIAVDQVMATKPKGSIEVLYRNVTREEKQSKRTTGSKKGTIVRGQKTHTFELVYDEEGTLRSMRFLSKGDPIKKVMNELESGKKKAETTEKWPLTQLDFEEVITSL